MCAGRANWDEAYDAMGLPRNPPGKREDYQACLKSRNFLIEAGFRKCLALLASDRAKGNIFKALELALQYNDDDDDKEEEEEDLDEIPRSAVTQVTIVFFSGPKQIIQPKPDDTISTYVQPNYKVISCGCELSRNCTFSELTTDKICVVEL